MNEIFNDPGSEHVERALKALREASRNVQAPEHIEICLRQAFRSQHARRPSRVRSWAGAALAATMLIAALVTFLLASAMRLEAPAPRLASIAPPAPVLRSQKTEVKLARAPAVRRAKPKAVVPQHDTEVVTDFFRIPYTPAFTQMDRGQLIRVRVPATSMRNFGLPVREERMFDRIRADVLVGEDGIARAIRFVK